MGMGREDDRDDSGARGYNNKDKNDILMLTHENANQ